MFSCILSTQTRNQSCSLLKQNQNQTNLSFLPVVSLGLEKFEFFLSHTEGMGKWAASTACSSISMGFCLLFFFTEPLCPWIFVLYLLNNPCDKPPCTQNMILQESSFSWGIHTTIQMVWNIENILIVEFYTNLDKYRSVHDKMCSYCLKFFTEIETLMASLLTSNTISLNLQNGQTQRHS